MGSFSAVKAELVQGSVRDLAAPSEGAAPEQAMTSWASRGVLVEDPEAVADALVAAVAEVGPSGLAMKTVPGHQITREDLLRLGRTMLRVQLER